MNNKKWNRVLTTATAVSLAIGTMAPVAFAASGSGTQYNTRTMNVGNGFTAVVQGLVSKDQGHMTEFLPVYYMMQGLGKMGYTVNWNGGTRTLNITTPTGVTVTAPSASVGMPGPDQMVIQLNGTSVMLAPRVVAKDPASGVMTTFAPVYYLTQALKSAGFTSTYNGQSWTLTGQAASQSASATLSNITVSNATSGTGTAASPAVSLSNAALTLSATLKDASGNPISNTAVTFNVSEYGNKPGQQPTVANASGTLIAPTTTSNADQYTVYTDANGVASIAVTGPSGQTYAYEVTASAPYSGSASGSLSTQAAYVDFVANNTAGIAPYASSPPFSASLGESVPITVTLPLNASNQPQANVLLTLQASGGSFVSSTGQLLGTEIQVATNSSGVAQAALTSATTTSTPIEVSVLASSLPAGVTAPSPTYINFGQAGIAAQVANYNITATSVQAGQNVTVYGTLEDASGNPVPNGQVIVVGNDTADGTVLSSGSNSGDFGYVTTSNGKSSVTDFPDVGNVTGSGSSAYVPLSSGMNANSSTGDVITADSNGNFSFVITDTQDGSNATFSIYPISNGQIASSTALKSGTVDYTAGTTLSSVSLAGNETQADGNTITSLTGLTAANHSYTTVVMDPQNAAGNPLTKQNLTYTVQVNNGGTVEGISSMDGNGNVVQTLPINSTNPGLSALTIDESYDSTTGIYTFTVPGQSGSITSSASPDLALYVYNGGTGATTLTVSSGSASATAAITFGGGAPSFTQTFSPANATISSGQTQTVTFQLQDANGNPVPNGIATIASGDTQDPMWITQVNGVTLQQNEILTAGTTNANSAPTPIPLGQVSSVAPSTTPTITSGAYTSGGTYLGYNTVNIPGVVSWTNLDGSGTQTAAWPQSTATYTNSSNASATASLSTTGGTAANAQSVQVYSNASGQVTLTLQGGGTSFYDDNYGLGSSTNGTSTTENFYTYSSKGNSGLSSWQIWISPSGKQPLNMPTPTEGTTYAPQTLQVLGAVNIGSYTSSSSLPGVLANASVTSAVYAAGTGTTVTGTLTDAFGNPIASHSINVTVDGVTGTTTTNSSGIFNITLVTPSTTGNQIVTITDKTATPNVTLSPSVTVS